MALKAFLITMIAAVVVAPALATDYMVGDDSGWKLDVNYTAWAQKYDFRVGDTLIFMYKVGAHNVLKVNGTDFQKCASSNTSAVPLTTGNDVIPLTSPGKKWYICGIGDHCTRGMKLVINVLAAEGPAPSPTPGSAAPTPGSAAPTPGTSAAGEVSPLKSCVWMLIVMAAYRMVMA